MKPSPLKRDPTYRMPRDPKKRLKPGGPLKRKAKRMKAVSPKRAQKRAKSVDLQRDAHGYSILEAQQYFLSRPFNVKDQVSCPDVCRQMHARFSERKGELSYGICWLCGRFDQIEAAHIVPKSDELCNINMLCGRFTDSNCHGKTEKNWAMLPKLLAIKLEHDPLNTDFRRIAELRRKNFTFDTLS